MSPARCIGRFGRALAAAIVAVAAIGEAHADPPSRIVSLNVCTDQLLLSLVPRERIAALSYLATDPTLSAASEAAQGLPFVVGATEEVLAHDPDLVLAQEYSTTATVGLLRRIGKRVVMVPMAQSFEGIRQAIRVIAHAVEEPSRGEALIAAFDKRLAALSQHRSRQPTALAYQVNSLASGPGTLLDEVIAAAGFYNLARELPLGPAGRLPLETLVASPPDVLVLGNAPGDFRSVVADNLRHPAFAELIRSRPTVDLPMSRWLCGTPAIAAVVEALGRARESIAAREADIVAGTGSIPPGSTRQ